MLNKYSFFLSLSLLFLGCSQNPVTPTNDESSDSFPRAPFISNTANDSPTATLHALLISDTLDDSSEEDKKELVRKGFEQDLKQMEELVDNISTHTGLRKNLAIIKGETLKKGKGHQAVTQAMDSWNIHPEDIVIFYYSGHGARRDDKISPWPFLYVEGNGQPKVLDTDSVINRLSNQSPKFFAVIIDACNQNVPASKTPDIKGPGNIINDNYSRLFLEHRGYFIASASQPGEYAFSAGENGGKFTGQFLGNLQEQLRSSNPDWTIVKGGAGKTIVLSENEAGQSSQTPYIESVIYTGKLEMKLLPSQQFKVGENMKISIRNQSTEKGYLLVWDLGSQKKLTAIFPNQYSKSDLFLDGGQTVTIPETDSYDLPMDDLLGTGYIIAIWLKNKIELNSSAIPVTTLIGLQKYFDQQVGAGNWSMAVSDYEVH